MDRDEALALVRGYGKSPEPPPEPIDRVASSHAMPVAVKGGRYADLFGAANAIGSDQDRPAEPMPTEPSARQALVRGGLQGATYGFGDELAAAIDTGVSKIPGLRNLADKLHDERFPSLVNPDVTYAERRNAYREANKEAEAAHGGAYLGGQLVGGLAAVPLAPEIGAAKTIGGAALRAAGTGAVLGAASGAGESEASDYGGMLRDTAKGAGFGALAGAVTGAVGRAVGKATEGAVDRIKKWVGKDIVGEVRGASTKTSKLNLQRDIDDVADVVTSDPRLEKTLRQASGHKDAGLIDEALSTTNAKLDEVTKPRPELYQAFDQELGGGVRAGDYVEHLEKAADALEGTGKGTDRAVAAHLRKRVEIIKDSTSWGGRQPVFDPDVQIGGERAGTLVSVLEKSKARASDPEAMDAEIAKIKGMASKPGFDPDHIVPAEKIRENVTDLQNAAYEAEGGLNGTPRYNRAKEVAGYAEDFLDNLKKKAAETNPDLMAQLDEHDRQVSALLRIQKVLQQRLSHAEQESLGATGSGMFGKLAHWAAHPKAGLIREGVAAAGKGAIAARRAIDRGSRALEQSDSQYAQMVLDGVRKGLPLAAAVEAAEAGGRAAPEGQ